MKRGIIVFFALIFVVVEAVVVTDFFKKRGSDSGFNLRTSMEDGKYYLYDVAISDYVEIDRKTFLLDRFYFSGIILSTLIGTMSFFYIIYVIVDVMTKKRKKRTE